MLKFRRKLSDAFAQSDRSSAEERLSNCLPATDYPVYDSEGNVKYFHGWHVFESQTARTHFIRHVLILLSQRGVQDLRNLHFDHFNYRSCDSHGVLQYTASIVATDPKDFSVRQAIVASRSAKDKTMAFLLLMLEIETCLHAHLSASMYFNSRAESAPAPPANPLKRQFSALKRQRTGKRSVAHSATSSQSSIDSFWSSASDDTTHSPISPANTSNAAFPVLETKPEVPPKNTPLVADAPPPTFRLAQPPKTALLPPKMDPRFHIRNQSAPTRIEIPRDGAISPTHFAKPVTAVYARNLPKPDWERAWI